MTHEVHRRESVRQFCRLTAWLSNFAWPFVLVIALWQVWITVGQIPEIVAPTPWQAISLPREYLQQTIADVGSTLLVIGGGLAAGMFFGVLLASVTWFSALASGLLTPITVLLNSIPSIALIPVVASIFGFNETTVVAVAALITFFPAFVLTRSGLDAIPPGSSDLMSVLGAGKLARFRYLAFPAAVPNMSTGLRIGAMLSVLGAITAEWLLGTSGMGYRLALAQQTIDMVRAWNMSILGVILSLVIFGLATIIESQVAQRFR